MATLEQLWLPNCADTVSNDHRPGKQKGFLGFLGFFSVAEKIRGQIISGAWCERGSAPGVETADIPDEPDVLEVGADYLKGFFMTGVLPHRVVLVRPRPIGKVSALSESAFQS